MTEYKMAELEKWVEKNVKIMNAIGSQAATDMLADIEVVPGINRGGERKLGTIPRDVGKLAASLQSTLYGSTSLTQSGVDSYVLVAGQIEIGTVAVFTWGSGEADYALPVHYGAGGVPGTYWRDKAAEKWPDYVYRATARAKAEILK